MKPDHQLIWWRRRYLTQSWVRQRCPTVGARALGRGEQRGSANVTAYGEEEHRDWQGRGGAGNFLFLINILILIKK
jgi:hypothetical protein